jgi:hypothetical protein
VFFNNPTKPSGDFSPKSDDDLFAGMDVMMFQSPVKKDSPPDLRRPLRRLFEDDEDRKSPKKKLRNRKEPNPPSHSPVKSAGVTVVSKTPVKSVAVAAVSKTPVKSAAVAVVSRTPVKSAAVSAVSKTPVKSAAVAVVSKTPVKSRPSLVADLPKDKTPVKSSGAQTPVKTPAQKRGDQNYGEDFRTPVKTPAQKRGDQDVIVPDISKTPSKSTLPKEPESGPSVFDGITALKSPIKSLAAPVTPVKSRTPIKRSGESHTLEKTPSKSSGVNFIKLSFLCQLRIS